MKIGPVSNPESINTKKGGKLEHNVGPTGLLSGYLATPLQEIKIENSTVPFLTIAYTKDSLQNRVT